MRGKCLIFTKNMIGAEYSNPTPNIPLSAVALIWSKLSRLARPNYVTPNPPFRLSNGLHFVAFWSAGALDGSSQSARAMQNAASLMVPWGRLAHFGF